MHGWRIPLNCIKWNTESNYLLCAAHNGIHNICNDLHMLYGIRVSLFYRFSIGYTEILQTCAKHAIPLRCCLLVCTQNGSSFQFILIEVRKQYTILKNLEGII